MELILTGRNFSGKEAGEWGLAARVFETPEECVDGAVETAEKIAGFSRVAVKAAKEVVNKSQDLGIREGVEYERRVFHGLFGSRDKGIGRLEGDFVLCGKGLLIVDCRYGGFCAEEEAGVVTWLNCLPLRRVLRRYVHIHIKHLALGLSRVSFRMLYFRKSHFVQFATKVSTYTSVAQTGYTNNKPVHSFVDAPAVHGRTSYNAPVPIPQLA